LWLAVAFAGGIGLQSVRQWELPEIWVLVVLSLLLVCLLAGLFEHLSVFRSPPFLLLFFFCLGILAGLRATPVLPAPSSLEPFFDMPQTLFLAQISAPPDIQPDRAQLSLKLQRAFVEGKSHRLETGVLLTLDKTLSGSSPGFLGDRLLVRLTLKRFHNFENPGGFDYVRNQAEKGLFARAHLSDDRFIVRLAPEPPTSPSSVLHGFGGRLDRFRQEALFWLKSNLDPDQAAFYSALLLGYRAPKSWAEHLNRAGVSHLLSISGLHMGLVSMCTFWFFRRLIRLLCPSILKRTSDQHLALWAALLAAILYALISGLALPTWRSVIMLVLFFGAAFWYRASDSLSALAASALLILLFTPNALRQISFQLSFAAMFGLFLLYPEFRRFQSSLWDRTLHSGHPLQRVLHPFVDAFWVSMAANLVVLPLLIYHFNGISLAGFLANTLLVPLVGFLVLQPGLAALAVYSINESLAVPILKIGGWFLEYCQDAILWFSHLSWAFFYVGAIPLLWLAAFYCGLAVVLSSLRSRTKAAGIAMLIVLILCSSFGPSCIEAFFHGFGLQDRDFAVREMSSSNPLKITVIDVGQGTSVLVQFPAGETMLVDGGGFFDDSFDVGRFVLAPFLWHSGIRRLDYVLLSHDHPDHRNGLRFIVSQFDVGELWESGISEMSNSSGGAGFQAGLAAIASRRGIPVRNLSEIVGEREIGPCRVNILHPTLSYVQDKWDGSDLNNISLVVRIDYGQTHFILPGDIDQSVERYIFENQPLPGRVILVSPHHGSERSNSSILFDRLQPQAVVFTCGYDNWFGFPSSAVLERCAARNITTYRTDYNGAVHAVSDGRQWTITSESETHANINTQNKREK
jgi:competence protein ComEC